MSARDPWAALNAELERALGPAPRGSMSAEPQSDRLRSPTGSLGPIDQQLDLDGRLHDLEPQSERMRLFEPAPAQLPGQTFIDTDTDASSDPHER